MDQLIETIEWAYLMGYEIERMNYNNGEVLVSVANINTDFWFTAEHTIKFTEPSTEKCRKENL